MVSQQPPAEATFPLGSTQVMTEHEGYQGLVTYAYWGIPPQSSYAVGLPTGLLEALTAASQPESLPTESSFLLSPLIGVRPTSRFVCSCSPASYPAQVLSHNQSLSLLTLYWHLLPRGPPLTHWHILFSNSKFYWNLAVMHCQVYQNTDCALKQITNGLLCYKGM